MESGAPGTSFGFQSTSSYPAFQPLSEMEKYGIMLNATGCTGAINQLACLRKAPLYLIIRGQKRVVGGICRLEKWKVAHIGFGPKRLHGGFPYSPTVDGLLIPDVPSRLFASGAFSRIPFISGNNLDEATQFLSSVAYTSINMTSISDLQNWVQSQLPLARYDTVPSIGDFHANRHALQFCSNHRIPPSLSKFSKVWISL